jgi:Cof subfamily protein (haloacid dehalogenase superfamily)
VTFVFLLGSLRRALNAQMINFSMTSLPIQLLALDIDGTLLNPQFQISEEDIAAVQRAQEMGVEIVVATGRRHQFAFPVVQKLGVDLCLISSNGAVTRSLTGERFHRDLLPVQICRELCADMDEFRGHLVVTFDKETKGTLVLERLDELNASIRRWLETNLEFIEFVVPVEKALVEDPVQAMYCGTIARMSEVQAKLEASSIWNRVNVLKTEYPERDLCMVDILNRGCSKGHALERWANHRGIAREQVMAIGDNYNDIEMLEYAGVPVIMGNASEELRGRDWRVTLPNSASGVAAAVAELVFGRAAVV